MPYAPLMTNYFIILLVMSGSLLPLTSRAQTNLRKPFDDCGLQGSITLYDYRKQQWICSDEADSRRETLPASTFKIINSLIALETGAIKDEHEAVPWVGSVDTARYGYRPDIYHDMNLREAYEVSAVWVYMVLAEKIGKTRYQQYLTQCRYGNGKLSEPGTDFWTRGPFGISPHNQVTFLKDLYEETLPFSRNTYRIVKQIMVAETGPGYTIRAKTGWTQDGGTDVGWWVGYVERPDNVYFFATRVEKPRTTVNPDFIQCRKDITKAVLRQLGVIE